MKIEKIEFINGNQYHVTFSPYFIEKLFGVKPKIIRYRNTGDTFTFGGDRVFIREDGKRLRNGDWVGVAIDKFINKF